MNAQQEQEIEIEKYVDLAYSRDEEARTPWPFSNLESVQSSDQFYPANEFHLYKYAHSPTPTPSLPSPDTHPYRWLQASTASV